MEKLEVCKLYDDKFTVVVKYLDFDSFFRDGTFHSTYEYYVIDTEEELLQLLNNEEAFLVEDIDMIYFAGSNILSKYLKIEEDKGYSELLGQWKI